MVSKNKDRVMVSLSKQTLKDLDELCNIYGMTKSQVIQLMVAVFHRERIGK